MGHRISIHPNPYRYFLPQEHTMQAGEVWRSQGASGYDDVWVWPQSWRSQPRRLNA
ncbi:hypothetical protein [Neosynechococcus sphagnicola]|uniref:hypothetical protein n=1 Tax=Neosynechococcus sphagnicola TaxID=1501145 RepID=UPI0012E046C5|nr:hypothetical protein [Neosynechococcus sphagnicola]